MKAIIIIIVLNYFNYMGAIIKYLEKNFEKN